MSDLITRRNELMTILNEVADQYTAANQLLLVCEDGYAYHTQGVNPLPSWQYHSIALSADGSGKIAYAVDEDNLDKRRQMSLTKFFDFLMRKGAIDPRPEVSSVSKLATEWPHLTNPDYSQRFSFEIVHGEELFEGYQVGPSSCMKGSDENQLALYVDNPDKVGLIKITDRGRYMGRALTWLADDGTRLVDRIYPSDTGAHARALREYAAQQGWDYVTRDCVGSDFQSKKNYEVTIGLPPRYATPYLDTFRFVINPVESLKEGKWVLTNFYDSSKRCYEVPHNPRNPTWDRLVWCDFSGQEVPDRDTLYHPAYGNIYTPWYNLQLATGNWTMWRDGWAYPTDTFQPHAVTGVSTPVALMACVQMDGHGTTGYVMEAEATYTPHGMVRHEDAVTFTVGDYLGQTGSRFHAVFEDDQIWELSDWQSTRGYQAPRFTSTNALAERFTQMYGDQQIVAIPMSGRKEPHFYRSLLEYADSGGLRDVYYHWVFVADQPKLIMRAYSYAHGHHFLTGASNIALVMDRGELMHTRLRPVGNGRLAGAELMLIVQENMPAEVDAAKQQSEAHKAMLGVTFAAWREKHGKAARRRAECVEVDVDF